MITNSPKDGENHSDVEIELPICKTQVFLREESYCQGESICRGESLCYICVCTDYLLLIYLCVSISYIYSYITALCQYLVQVIINTSIHFISTTQIKIDREIFRGKGK